MTLKKIRLVAFRNFNDKIFNFHPSLTIIFGQNSRGKTNLLEGVFLSLYGTGFRESKEEELIQWGKDENLIETTFAENETEQLSQTLIKKHNDLIEKKFFVNKTKKNLHSYLQYQDRAVLFAPEHIEIITGSPDKRREYFNKLLFLFDSEYKKKLHNYEHALYKRNKILEHHSAKDTLKEELIFWDKYLRDQSIYITQKRQEYVDFLNLNKSIDGKIFGVKYIKNKFTMERLIDIHEEELRLKRTLIGPQKDDFQIYLSNGEEKNVHHFGSRSEQRLAVFWLKINEIKYFESNLKKTPILLLDDVFSELDTSNKKLVLHLIGNYQTILTTTEKELLELVEMPKIVISL